MMNGEVLIRIRGLWQTYGKSGREQAAVKDISGDIYRGEFLALVGPNGSGKSTLVAHFNALLQPSAGSVEVAGMLTSDPANRWEIRRLVGMVGQHPDDQIVAAVVEEDVAFGPENLGLDPAEVRRRVDEALRLTGLEGCRSKAVHALSGGEKQRLAVAGVLAMRPVCLVLDEPTSMLDPVGRRELLETLCRLNRDEGTTVVLVTHLMEEVTLADRVWVMAGGRLEFQGRPAEVFAAVDRLNELGLVLPRPVELARRLRSAGIDVPDDVLTAEDLVTALCRL